MTTPESKALAISAVKQLAACNMTAAHRSPAMNDHCTLCGRPPHPVDDPECCYPSASMSERMEVLRRRAERAEAALAEANQNWGDLVRAQQGRADAAEARLAVVDALAASTPSVEPVAPWPDFLGQPIRHGDRLIHPTGEEFVAVRLNGQRDEGDAWRCIYDNNPQNVSRLCLQIGDKGRAVLLATPTTAPAVEPQAVPAALTDADVGALIEQTAPDMTLIADPRMRAAAEAYHRAPGGHWFKLKAAIDATPTVEPAGAGEAVSLLAEASKMRGLPHWPFPGCDDTSKTIAQWWRRVEKVIAASPSTAAPKAQAQASVPAGFALVPIRLTRAMKEALADEDFEWRDLLVAAEAITERDYNATETDELSDEEAIQMLDSSGLDIEGDPAVAIEILQRGYRFGLLHQDPPPREQAALAVTDAMVTAYLTANDAYWHKTDELPKEPGKWRNGTSREATRVSLEAALSAAPHPKAQAQAGETAGPVHWRAVLAADQVPMQLNPAQHVVGFRTFKAADAWVASERDFAGWNYTIEPLYLAPSAPKEGTAPKAQAQADGEVEKLRAALHYVAFALHGTPLNMLATGITLHDNNRVTVKVGDISVDTGRLAEPFKLFDAARDLQRAASAGTAPEQSADHIADASKMVATPQGGGDRNNEFERGYLAGQQNERELRSTKAGMVEGPFISADEQGNAVFEWWGGARKITLYTVGKPDESLLRSWGTDMETQMAFVPLTDPAAVSAAFAWLAAAHPSASGEGVPLTGPCEGCDLPNGCPEYCRCGNPPAPEAGKAVPLTDEQIAEFGALCVMNSQRKLTSRQMLAEYRELNGLAAPSPPSAPPPVSGKEAP